MSVLVIAEPGCTAEGDLGKMLALAVVARGADCGAFKPQFCSNAERMCERRNIGLDHPQREYYERAYGWLRWSESSLAEMRQLCRELGLQFALTVFIPEDVPVAAQYADILKIASFENGDCALLKAAAKTDRRVIISTGMVGGDDEIHTIDDAEHLHCTSAYPAPIEALNLRVIRNHWNIGGLSDHSRDLDVGAFAVCAGAYIIETHFRLYDCNPNNPDYPVAFDPGELAMYVGKIRKAERAMGNGVKRVQPCEEWALPYRVST